MLAALPLAALLPLVALFAFRGRDAGRAILAGAVVWGTLVLAITELASLAGRLDVSTLAVAWGAVLAGGAIALWRAPRNIPAESGAAESRPLADRLLLAGVGVLLAATLVTGLVSAPNNWDSMTYHLARIEHWLQNSSVGHYATHNLRQLFFTPWAEFAQLHFRALAGGDRLVALVQWLAFGGYLVGASVVAGELGAGRRGRLFAAVFAATLPMSVLQASSTQNDAIAAFWLMAALAFLLPLRRRASLSDALLAGAAIGLLALTKSTGAICAVPFALWVGIEALARKNLAILKLAPVMLAVALAFNAGHWQRNLALFDHPIGPVERFQYTNADPGVPVAASNALRNVAVHLQTPWAGLNESIYGAFIALIEGLGLDPNPPGSAFRDLRFEPASLWREENNAAAPLHVLLLFAALPLLPAALARGERRTNLLYALSGIAAFLLFSLVVRWQPTQVRLLLPLLVAWAPLAGRMMGSERLARPAAVALLAVTLYALPMAFANQTRPLVGKASLFTTERFDEYFNSRPWEGERIRQLVDRLRRAGCYDVGFTGRDNSYEYPVWVRLRDGAPRPPRLRHVRVRNESRPLLALQRGFEPCAALRLYGGIQPGHVQLLGK